MPASAGRGDLTSGSDRLDSVEIRVTFSGAGAAAATRALAPDTGGARRRVYFCEALARSTAPGQLPLLDAGLILRLRAGSGRGGAATAELRPCRRSRLSERWLRFREQGPDSLGLSDVWAGDRRVLSATLTSACDRTAVEAAVTGGKPLTSVFSAHQQDFLTDCADTAVPFDSLTVLGPVHSTRWLTARLDHHEVTLEHCGLAAAGHEDDHPLQWLEVSKRVSPEGAEVVRASLLALLKAKDLDPDLDSGIRLRRVLEELAAERP
ncbi:hypothetical protein ACWD4G_22340 [Streptomyces sp. NPDC002643]